MSSESARTCPNCGRLVEPGFKFCDGCGTRLDAPQPLIAPPPVDQAPKVPPLVDQPPKVPPPVSKPPTPSPSRPEPSGIEPPPEHKPSFLERRRERKTEDEAARARVESTPEPAPAAAPPSDTSEEPRKPLLERLRRPKEEAAERTADLERPDVEPEPEEPAQWKPSLLERLRERKQARAAAEAGVSPTPPASLREPPPIDVTPEQLAQRPAAATSKPVTAEELRGARPAIGGRLRWSGEEARGIERPDDDVTRGDIKFARPVDQEREGIGGRWIAIFVLHLFLAMVAGAVLVGATAAIASLVSSGNVALLEIRGLPIFIGGATAVMLFTLLRTGKRAPEAERRSVIASVVIGFVILVAASTLLLQPRVIENVQGDLEKALRVYGPDETEAVNDFIVDINVWNTETTSYRDDVVSPLLRGQFNIDDFRFNAAGTEETLKGTVNSMRTNADSSDNRRLRDALGDLAAVYEERLSAILLITRGLVNNDQALVNSGETRRDASKARAVDFFDQRLKPLLERADIDADSFATAVAGGY